MRVSLVGLGCGDADTMTLAGREALLGADCLIGAARLLESVGDFCPAPRYAATRAEEILTLLHRVGGERPCVVYSGDTGFYSGAKTLLPLLKEAGLETRVLPGVSSVQLLAARLGRPWQDWALVSAHGLDCDPVAAVCQGKPAFFLTGGQLTPAALCRGLVQAGLGTLEVTVGERLSYSDEVIHRGTAADFADGDFDSLSVLLAEPAEGMLPRRCPGFPDGAFLRDKTTPMTKQEVRAAALAKLAVRESDVVWDIGAGTGSVAVELALAARRGRVFAVECQEEAFGLLEENRRRLGAWNLTAIFGKAPEALAELPAPDAVFLGGTKGRLRDIVDVIMEKNPRARICVSAIALETLGEAVAALTAHGLRPEVTQISVSRSREAGTLHLLLANNPVFLISGALEEERL